VSDGSPDIIVHLDRVLLERHMTLSQLSDRVGVTPANLSILKTNKARAIRFTTLEAICRELDCQPGDLLEYRPAAALAIDAAPRLTGDVDGMTIENR